jgi:hypothetical protein
LKTWNFFSLIHAKTHCCLLTGKDKQNLSFGLLKMGAIALCNFQGESLVICSLKFKQKYKF